MKIRLLGFIILILLTTACQPAALPTPASPPPVTPTPQPPPTVTAIPPTAIPPAATVTSAPPTPTSTSTRIPPTLPPIPTADFTLADLQGMWMRSDPDRGDLFLTFLDGGYLAAHGTPEGVVHAGKFSLQDSLLTFLDGWNCSPMPDDTPGGYLVRLGNANKWLFLDVYADACPDRPSSLKSYRWTRLVPAP